MAGRRISSPSAPRKFDALRAEFLSRLEAGELLTWQPLVDGGMRRGDAQKHTVRWCDMGVIHIDHYRRATGGGRATPVFISGPGENAKKPEPLTKREMNRRYWKGNVELLIRRTAKRRAKRLREHPPKLDPLMAALIGENRD